MNNSSITADQLAKAMLVVLASLNIDAPEGIDFMTKRIVVNSITEKDMTLSTDEITEKFLVPIATNHEKYQWTDIEYLRLPKGIDEDAIKLTVPKGLDDFCSYDAYKNIQILVLRQYDINSGYILTGFKILVKKLPAYSAR